MLIVRKMIHMKYQALFKGKNKYFRMSFSTVVIRTLRIVIAINAYNKLDILSLK